MKVTIEYCTAWNYKPRASSLEDELKNAFGSQVEVELIPGAGGVYTVCVDGKQIFAKKEVNRFPDEGEILSLLK